MTSHIVRQTMLAEAVGGPIWDAYIHPAQNPGRIDLPDPYTNAKDCEALIKHLNGKGYDVILGINSNNRHDVDLHKETKWLCHWQGDDWKQGVCDLALKVLGIDTSE